MKVLDVNWRIFEAIIIRGTRTLREHFFSSDRLTMLFFNVYVRSFHFNFGNWDLTTIALKNALDKYVNHGQKVLEVGTGPFAILSIYIVKKKRVEVTAVDIYPDFIENAKKTARYNGIFVNFLESDLFSNVKGLFDIVFFNPPYLPREYAIQICRNKPSNHFRLVCNGGPNGCETIRRFLKQVSIVMHRNSKVLLGVNEWFVSAKKIEKLIHENGLKLVSVDSSLWNPSRVFVIENNYGNVTTQVY